MTRPGDSNADDAVPHEPVHHELGVNQDVRKPSYGSPFCSKPSASPTTTSQEKPTHRLVTKVNFGQITV